MRLAREVPTFHTSTAPLLALSFGIEQEAERGEDIAVESYQKALKADLPSDVRALVERQSQGVQENHNRIRDLRDQYAKR